VHSSSRTPLCRRALWRRKPMALRHVQGSVARPRPPCWPTLGRQPPHRAQTELRKLISQQSTSCGSPEASYASPSNEKEISHGGAAWQTCWRSFDVGTLASSVG